MDVIYEDIDTPIGTFRVAERDGRLIAASFLDGWDELIRRVDGSTAIVEGPTRSGAAVRAYFEGDLTALDQLDVAFEGSPFQRAVWTELRRIPAGATISYAQLAEAVGAPRAFRAAGTANGANPVSVIVPCHRVVRADGTTGGYGGGTDRKRWLLEHEHALA